MVASAFAESQYKVLYSFGSSGPNDGSGPRSRLLMDGAGNLYGTTGGGGMNGAGTVFELTPAPDGTWNESTLYNFCSQDQCADGRGPVAGLIFDQTGNLYGTTLQGGISGEACCWGTVFELSPPAAPGNSWIETVLYTFGGNTYNDGCYPKAPLTFDALGNLYGTASQCGDGQNPNGSVFELTPSGNGTWTETVLHNFTCTKPVGGCNGGALPMAGVVFDKSGNLYGTTQHGGNPQSEGTGTVYKLSPGPQGWTETVLYTFGSTGNVRGADPVAPINFDSAGNMYSTVYWGGQYGLGGVFRLSPSQKTEITLSFDGALGHPAAGVLIDPRNRDLYGTSAGSQSYGSVFKISKEKVTTLYSFTGGADGGMPVAALIADKKGHIYGTAEVGGDFGQGVVFEIIP